LSRFASLLNPAKAEMAVLPKRIIDVGETNDEFVSLRDFGDKPTSAHYVCLSHRWQRSCPLITTQLNIESRKAKIPMDELSATLSDAILLTRAFNIRYLWIDSLCILQDSTLDWEIESSRMGAYYSRSWLTLAAGLDHDPDLAQNGFYQTSSIFGPRYKPGTSAGYYQLPMPGSKTISKLYFNLQDELKWDNRGSSYLYTRGWTLQEEALSPRFLSFQPRQTSLRIGNRVYHESRFSQKISDTSFLTIDGLDFDNWTRLVEDYSQRYLSKEGDKLPALSGIAQLYQEKHKDTYLAGIWLSRLLEHLCWCVPNDATESHRPSDYRAPSWSWASIDGKVVFDSHPGSIHNIKILEATTVPAGKDPLGQVREGSILFYAKMNEQHWKRESGSKRKWYYAEPCQKDFPSLSKSIGLGTPFSTAMLLLDVHDCTVDELYLWSLPIHDQFALALQVVDPAEHIFKRIGSICWRSKKDDGDEREPATTLSII
jgi:hypothetical protein